VVRRICGPLAAVSLGLLAGACGGTPTAAPAARTPTASPQTPSAAREAPVPLPQLRRANAICARYNAELAAIGRTVGGASPIAAQAAAAHLTNVATIREFDALLRDEVPASVAAIFRAGIAAARQADASTRLIGEGDAAAADRASLGAVTAIGQVNDDLRRVGLAVCAD
jgi:hypothetical protein